LLWLSHYQNNLTHKSSSPSRVKGYKQNNMKRNPSIDVWYTDPERETGQGILYAEGLDSIVEGKKIMK
jgi:hypothetical protein